jgi:hypothetical protein
MKPAFVQAEWFSNVLLLQFKSADATFTDHRTSHFARWLSTLEFVAGPTKCDKKPLQHTVIPPLVFLIQVPGRGPSRTRKFW